jgi:hypothetical protein
MFDSATCSLVMYEIVIFLVFRKYGPNSGKIDLDFKKFTTFLNP